ncbi:MAG: c-type cytochrome [Halofilum sp. (in: g-proteobacteria)]
MKKAMAAIAFLALTGTAAVAAEDGPALKAGGDPAAGEELAQTCAACHGSDGNSPQAEWPNIAGQHAGYTFEQLQAFKAGEARSNAQMAGIVADLSEQEMRDLAAFYSEQPIKIMGASDEERVARGREIYLGGIPDKDVASCVACHGPRGRGNPAADYPAVGGQWGEYLVTQLEAFRSGERANDENEVMRALAAEMTDEEIRAVSEYMGGLN